MLRAAIVGLGWWGQNILRLMSDSDAIRITAATDPAPQAAETAKTFNLSLASFDSMLADSAIDAVILCTPHRQHRAQILGAAHAKKHVFCEKPLCLTRADAQEAIAACQINGVTLGVGHERRFEPPILELRRMLAAGDLGDALQIEANFSQDKFLNLPQDNWRLSAEDAPAGPMTATGIHLLDLAVSLLGPADNAFVQVRQLGSRMVNGDTLGALVNFKSGANALISAILATPFDGRFALYGSKGWVEVRDKAHPESPQGWTLTSSIRGKAREVTEYKPAPAVRRNLETFARAAMGGLPYPVPHSEMLATIAVLEAIFRSAKSGRPERVEN